MFDYIRLFREPGKSNTFIVAEIGINHNGNPQLARQLISAAAECGADAVKFQVFQTENFYNRRLLPDAYALFKQYELSYADFRDLKEFAESLGLVFFATPLDTVSLGELVDMGVPLLKFASSDIFTEPFLELGKQTGLPVILSTGFASGDDVRRALEILGEGDRAVLYCVSQYPASPDMFDLNVIPHFQDTLHVPVGFSDHSGDIYLSLGAVGLGAKIIERHFTIDNTLEGGDHAMSLNPERFKAMCAGIRVMEKALGNGEKKINEGETRIAGLSLRGMYASGFIPQGQVITEKDILWLRPGTGINLKRYQELIGTKARKDFQKYEDILGSD